MRDIIWTIIVIWVVFRLIEAFRSMSAKKSTSYQNSQSYKTNSHSYQNKPEGSVTVDAPGESQNGKKPKEMPTDGEYIDFEEIK